MVKRTSTVFLLMPLSLLVVVTLEAFLFKPRMISQLAEKAPALSPQQQLQLIDPQHPLLSIHQLAFDDPEAAAKEIEMWQQKQPTDIQVIEQIYALGIHRVIAKNQPHRIAQIDAALTELAQENNLDWLKVKLQIESAYRDIQRGTYQNGIEKIEPAIEIAKSINADFLLLEAYNTAGILYNANNQLTLSKNSFKKGIDLGEKYPESEFNARFNNNLAVLYIHSEQWERAIEYLQRSESMYRESSFSQSESLLIALMNQSYVYNKLGQVKESREAYQKGTQYILANTSQYYKIIAIKSKSRLLLLERKPLEAAQAAQQCIQSPGIDKFPKQKGICQFEYALSLSDAGRVDDAHQAITDSINTFVTTEHDRWLIKSHLILADILEKQGKFEQALHIYKKYHSQEREQILGQIHVLETAYKVEEVERERDLLDVQNELQVIEKELSEQRLRVMYTWLVVVGILVIWLFVRFRRERKRSQHLHDLSFKDPLTRVGNRRLYHRELESPLLVDKAQQYRLTLVDIDWFKTINDKYGHEIGDKVLTDTATRLRSELTDKELIVRWGGEEFLLLLADSTDFQARAQSLVDSVSGEPYKIDELSLPVSISVGVSDATELDKLKGSQSAFKHADTCLYQAKAQGRNQVVLDEDLR